MIANWGAHATKSRRGVDARRPLGGGGTTLRTQSVGDVDRIDSAPRSRGATCGSGCCAAPPAQALLNWLVKDQPWDVFFAGFSELHPGQPPLLARRQPNARASQGDRRAGTRGHHRVRLRGGRRRDRRDDRSCRSRRARDSRRQPRHGTAASRVVAPERDPRPVGGRRPALWRSPAEPSDRGSRVSGAS